MHLQFISHTWSLCSTLLFSLNTNTNNNNMRKLFSIHKAYLEILRVLLPFCFFLMSLCLNYNKGVLIFVFLLLCLPLVMSTLWRKFVIKIKLNLLNIPLSINMARDSCIIKETFIMFTWFSFVISPLKVLWRILVYAWTSAHQEILLWDLESIIKIIRECIM